MSALLDGFDLGDDVDESLALSLLDEELHAPGVAFGSRAEELEQLRLVRVLAVGFRDRAREEVLVPGLESSAKADATAALRLGDVAGSSSGGSGAGASASHDPDPDDGTVKLGPRGEAQPAVRRGFGGGRPRRRRGRERSQFGRA